MLDQLLPDDLLKKVQSTAVDPRVESSEHGMPVYNAESGENMKVFASSMFGHDNTVF